MRHSPALLLRCLLPCALLASLALLPRDAQAQRYQGGRPGQALGSPSGSLERSNRPPPTALPGLTARGNVEPIPADPNANLAPTPALFDAINRGDLYAARDAVARGADPDATNVLGLTPLDAAVDQGRNDIMFFLLSVRGARPTGGPAEDVQSAFRSQPAVPESAARAGRAARAQAAAASSTVAAPRVTAPEVLPGGPRLWAGDGGAAKPEVGFLGFDAGRPAGAGPAPAAIPAAARRARS
jgi:hypothetical protein